MAGFRGVTKIRESIHAVFLHHCILESGMDVGIVNSHELLALESLDEDMRLLCEDLVFNRNEEATELMLERTAYERACIDARKKGLAPPRKPRGKIINKPRLQFDYDKIPPKKATEPPLPSSYAAQNHVPNPYLNSQIAHEKIQAVREKAKFSSDGASWKSLEIDYTQVCFS